LTAAARPADLQGDAGEKPAMMNQADCEAHALAVAAAIGLPIAPAHLPGVAANLLLAARMADVVRAVALPPATEPAPVFQARPATPAP
jgi:hypothetical protein